MAPRKLPPGEKQIHVGISLPPELWARAQRFSELRGAKCSASAIVREALTEYLDRRTGPAQAEVA